MTHNAAPNEGFASESLLIAAAGLLIGLVAASTGTIHPTGALAIPIGLVIGHAAARARLGRPSTPYAVGGVAAVTALQYAVFLPA